MALCSVQSNMLAGFCSDKTWEEVKMLLLGITMCLWHWRGRRRIHWLPRCGLEFVHALKMSSQVHAWGRRQSLKHHTEKLSKLKHCTHDSLIQEQRMHSLFSLNTEVNNEIKHPFEICTYHLQEALPNNQWQLGWQANFRAKPEGIQIYFRFAIDSKGQRKNKLSKRCHATTNLCWPSRN